MVVGVGSAAKGKRIFEDGHARQVSSINPYLAEGDQTIVQRQPSSVATLPPMQFGNHPYYAMNLIFSQREAARLVERDGRAAAFIRPLYGSQEFINGSPRMCLWIRDREIGSAEQIPDFAQKLAMVRQERLAVVGDAAAQKLAHHPYRFRDQVEADKHVVIVPRVSSESRSVLPVGLLSADSVIQDQAFALYDAPPWTIALIASRVHLVWIATVCGKLETRYRYSNTLGWNTFPVPPLTERNKIDLTRCAENILLAREAHFPATIAELYDPDDMPDDLRQAHEANDETLERIYIGRRFRNDTERLEKLFEMYARMTAGTAQAGPRGRRPRPKLDALPRG